MIILMSHLSELFINIICTLYMVYAMYVYFFTYAKSMYYI